MKVSVPFKNWQSKRTFATLRTKNQLLHLVVCWLLDFWKHQVHQHYSWNIFFCLSEYNKQKMDLIDWELPPLAPEFTFNSYWKWGLKRKSCGSFRFLKVFLSLNWIDAFYLGKFFFTCNSIVTELWFENINEHPNICKKNVFFKTLFF